MSKLTVYKKDDVVAFTTWAKVKGNLGGALECEHLTGPLKGSSFAIHGSELISLCLSADFFCETENVTKTRAAELLVSSYNIPFTVVFEKSDGTERTLRGKLIHPEPLLGRSMVHDLDADGPRLVDHRTIKSLTVNHIKYVVK